MIDATPTRLTNPEPRPDTDHTPRTAVKVSIAKTVETANPDTGETEDTEHIIELTLNPSIPTMVLLEISVASRSGEYAEQLWTALTETLPPAELDRFKVWARKVDASYRELLSWSGQMVGVLTARPTEGQPPSQDGLPNPETFNGSTGAGEPGPAANGGSPL